MSQKKVDQYKERKANREKIYKREKRILLIEKLAALLVCLVAVGWLGYSIYGQYQKNAGSKVETTAVDVSAIDDYLSGMNASAEDAE
ncbi:MAG: hypothetical protein ACOYBE_07635 [Blautia sp.]|jgi:hypothetical protein